ncbi:MAG: MMPL family transporter [Bacillota bacterium]|nr:MMPL family transporter [Bacillota bacterium]
MFFYRLGKKVIKFKWIVLVAWILAAGLILWRAPQLSKVARSDQEIFMPGNVDIVKYSHMMKELYPDKGSGSSVFLALERKGGITDEDRTYGKSLEDFLLSNKSQYNVQDIKSPFSQKELEDSMISKDKESAIVAVSLSSSSFSDASNAVIRSIRDNVIKGKDSKAPAAPQGLTVNVTGDAALGEEEIDTIQSSMAVTGKITVALVIVILILIYKSPIAPIVPLFTIGLSFFISRGVIAAMTYLGLKVSSFTETFLIAVLFGAGTDYCLLIISRYREEIVNGKAPLEALADAFANTITAVLSSGGTVIVGFLCMAFAQFGLFNTTGPRIAVGVGITLLAVLTVTPALLAILGERIFWPVLPSKNIEKEKRGSSFWKKLSVVVTSKPGIFIISCLVVLTPFIICTKNITRTFDNLAELPKTSDAVVGFNVIKAHFDQGEMLPVKVVLKSDKDLWSNEALQTIDNIAQNILKVDGTAKVRTATRPLGEQINEVSLHKQIGLFTDGLDEINTGFDPIIDGMNKMQDGVKTAANGLNNAAQGMNTLADKTQEAADGTSKVGAGMGTLSSGQQSAISGMDDINSGLGSISAGVVQSKQGINSMYTALQNAKASMDELLKYNLLLMADKNFQTAYGTVKGVLDNMPAVIAGLDKVSSGVSEVQKGTVSTEDGLKSIKAGIDQSRTALDTVVKGMGAIKDNQKKAGSDLQTAADGLSQIAEGFDPSKKGLADMKSGVSTVEDASRAYSSDGKNLSSVFYLPEGTLEKYPELKAAMQNYITTDGKGITFEVVLSTPPYGAESLDSINKIRDAIAFTIKGSPLQKAEFHVGGSTASSDELRSMTSSDFVIVMICVLMGIFIVLAILLRSLIAPFYLILTIIFSFGTTMGIAYLVFQVILGKPGLSWSVPFFSFCILVALGVDYNIFLMTRVREEYKPRDIAGGTARALASTGGIITSCGIIMAGTFGAMVASPITMLVQIGFTTVVGLLLDTFIIRCLVVPAIAVKVGELNWWPGRRVRVLPVDADGAGNVTIEG